MKTGQGCIQNIKFKVVNENRRSYIIDDDSAFSLEYIEGKTVNALPGSIGIAVFDTIQNAKDFINVDTTAKILKVKAMGEERALKEVAFICSMDDGIRCDNIIKHFLAGDREHGRTPPRGSIFYPAVKVLN